jgi:glycolate oxidase
MVGSEGTLGIITQVVLKLLPLPPARNLIWCRLPDIMMATEAVTQIMGEGLMPSVLEIMDQSTVSAVGDYLGKDMGSGVSLLIEFDGTKSVCQEDASKAAAILKSKSGSEIDSDLRGEESQALWRARRSVLPALTRMAPTVIIEDVTLPRTRQPKMAGVIGKIADDYGVKVAIFGHAGDGNMHPTFLADSKDTDAMKRIDAAVGQMMRACVDLGGTVSGEHGIGLDKAPFLKLELGGAGYDIMRRLKASLDPKDIMNPGKMFYDS